LPLSFGFAIWFFVFVFRCHPERSEGSAFALRVLPSPFVVIPTERSDEGSLFKLCKWLLGIPEEQSSEVPRNGEVRAQILTAIRGNNEAKATCTVMK
jgi:hypothetical protein